MGGHTEVISLLLNNGADIETKNKVIPTHRSYSCAYPYPYLTLYNIPIPPYANMYIVEWIDSCYVRRYVRPEGSDVPATGERSEYSGKGSGTPLITSYMRIFATQTPRLTASF
jgi:hypothetical protein